MKNKKNKKTTNPTPFGILSAVVLLAILIINIFLSQTISPIYFAFINENINSTIVYLKKIKPLPEFNKELIKYTNYYGGSIKKEVFREEVDRRGDIKKLEEMLVRNPNARDVLYRLYILYKEEGNNKIASDYLDRAIKIDPTIENIGDY